MNIVNIIDLVDDNMDISYIRNINPNDTIIVGKMNKIIINYNINNLDLSRVDCNIISYNSIDENINNILPNNLEKLIFEHCNIDQFPLFPESINELFFYNCNITNFNILPNNLLKLGLYNCNFNKLPKFVESLEEINIISCKIDKLNKLPKNLKKLKITHSNLSYLPKLPNNLELLLYQEFKEININYNPTIKLIGLSSRIKLCDYDKVLCNQEDYDEYMKYIYRNKNIKSARK